jgi:hypothetical protein
MPRNGDAAPASSQRAWRRVVAVLAVMAALLVIVWMFVRKPSANTTASADTPPAPPAVAAAVPTPALAADVPTGAAPATAVDPNLPRMRAMVFEMDANGVQLRQSSVTSGRVKAAPRSDSPRRVEFEVYGADGAPLYAGAFDHPLWQRPEAVDEKGELTSAERQIANGSCFVRIPAELPATRIELFEIDATTGNNARRSLGSFDLTL